MKSDKRIIDALNGLLADELTAINQYMVHSEMCDDWGYEKLHQHFEKRAIDEMKHAEKLIGRILFLEGTPIVSELRKINIGASVDKQLEKDHEAEYIAIKGYNEAIALAAELKDFATRDFLQDILICAPKLVLFIKASLPCHLTSSVDFFAYYCYIHCASCARASLRIFPSFADAPAVRARNPGP